MKRRWRLIALAGLLALLGSVNALQLSAQHRQRSGHWLSQAAAPAEVAITQAPSWPLSDAQVEALVRQAVALAGGLEGVVQDGDTVVVKPNLVWNAPPAEGAVTDPRVVRAVIRLALEAGAGQVLVAEGAAGYYDYQPDARGATMAAFRDAGYDADGDLLDDVTGVPLIDLNDAGGLDQHDPTLVRQVHLQNGLIWTDYWLPNRILDADVLIGVPVLKNHSYAGITLALKNQIGIAPSDIYHSPGSHMFKGALGHGPSDLGRHIVDLNLARPLDFVVVDGLRGLTDGPTGSALADPPMRLVLAGRDAVAVDTIGALVMGYDPASIPYLGWAAEAGLGTGSVAHISVRGLRLSQVRRDFPAPYGDPPAQRAERLSPAIHITAPEEGNVVTEQTTVWATASDDEAVSKVEFYVDDELQAVATAPPYWATLDLSAYRGQAVTDHESRLRALAYDLALNDAGDQRTVTVVQAPPPGAVSIQTATLTIPTYPYAHCLQPRSSGPYTYQWLDWACYGDPALAPRNYTLLVLENDYLRVTLLPELGGRVYQMIFKPTGHNELYQNPVVKPTHWGPAEQGWWLAAGGLEWCFPVDEHGYEWGEVWAYQVVTSTAGVTVTLQDTAAVDRLRVAVAVHLPAGRSTLAIRPRIENPTGSDLPFKYWTNAALAPGQANRAGPDLRLIFSAGQVTVHSSGDFGPGQVLQWPVHDGRDYSRLGNWGHWLGFFERPQAAAGFIAVYDAAADEGVARVFPPDVARGTKGFGFGWSEPYDPHTWTDDGSTYVELHGGVAPTFWDTAVLTAHHALEWTEYWYPVSGIGHLSAATAEAALGVRESTCHSERSEESRSEESRFYVGVHTTVPRAAGTSTLYAWDRQSCAEVVHRDLPAIEPGRPFTAPVGTGGHALDDVAFVYLDGTGNLLAALNPRDCLPPTSSVAPLDPWVGTLAFPVTWAGQDAWSGIAAYDVQARDGYEGAWIGWAVNTTATSGTFSGVHGHTYFFRARARDQAGNWGSFGDEEWGQAFTTVLAEPAPVLVTSRKAAVPHRFGPGQAVSYTISIRNIGSLAATAVLTDTLPAEMAMLTGTLAATSGPTPACADGRVYWTGTLMPDSEVRVTYALSPTATTPFGLPMTNTAEIAGSVLGPLTRQATVVQTYSVWTPVVMKNASP